MSSDLFDDLPELEDQYDYVRPPAAEFNEPLIDVHAEPPRYADCVTPVAASSVGKPIQQNPVIPTPPSHQSTSIFSKIIGKIKGFFSTGSYDPNSFEAYHASRQPLDPGTETGMVTTYSIAGLGVGALLSKVITTYAPLAVAGVIGYQVLKYTGKIGNIDFVETGKRCIGALVVAFNITEDDIDNYQEYIEEQFRAQMAVFSSSMAVTVSFAGGVIVGLLFF